MIRYDDSARDNATAQGPTKRGGILDDDSAQAQGPMKRRRNFDEAQAIRVFVEYYCTQSVWIGAHASLIVAMGGVCRDTRRATSRARFMVKLELIKRRMTTLCAALLKKQESKECYHKPAPFAGRAKFVRLYVAYDRATLYTAYGTAIMYMRDAEARTATVFFYKWFDKKFDINSADAAAAWERVVPTHQVADTVISTLDGVQSVYTVTTVKKT